MTPLARSNLKFWLFVLPAGLSAFALFIIGLWMIIPALWRALLEIRLDGVADRLDYLAAAGFALWLANVFFRTLSRNFRSRSPAKTEKQ